jgi:hypothetical protein
VSIDDSQEMRKPTNYASYTIVPRYRFTMIAFSSLKSLSKVYSRLL